MKLIQENGQPRYGRFDQIPSRINLDDYIYKTPYGQVLKGWRKQLKYKKFRFCGLQHEHYSIGVAIVDLSWACNTCRSGLGRDRRRVRAMRCHCV